MLSNLIIERRPPVRYDVWRPLNATHPILAFILMGIGIAAGVAAFRGIVLPRGGARCLLALPPSGYRVDGITFDL